MSQFKWEARFDIGVAAMNRDHQELLSLMDRLEDLVINKADKTATANALLALKEFTIKHFSQEENFLEKIHYPELSIHKGVHTNLISKLKMYQDNFEKNGKFDDDFFGFLKIWLSSHICGIDNKYGKFANNPKAS